jgi:hypothetical protein
MDVHLSLLAEKAGDSIERLDTAREFAAKAIAIHCDRDNSLSYLPRQKDALLAA